MTTGNCWQEIGVEGDRSCDQLATMRHCHYCPVYVTAGRRLFDRPIPQDYLQTWTEVFAQPEAIASTIQSDQSDPLINGKVAPNCSVIIFRLGSEKFALPVNVLQEVTRPSAVHTLPHRSNDVFLGLVNIHGAILLCVSLHHLLNVETSIDPTNSRINLRRFLVIGEEICWVFPADEVYRVYRFHTEGFEDTPVVIAKASKAYTQAIFSWQDGKVNYLNADRLLSALNRLL